MESDLTLNNIYIYDENGIPIHRNEDFFNKKIRKNVYLTNQSTSEIQNRRVDMSINKLTIEIPREGVIEISNTPYTPPPSPELYPIDRKINRTTSFLFDSKRELFDKMSENAAKKIKAEHIQKAT